MAIIYTDQDIRQNVWEEITHDVRIDSGAIRVTVAERVVYLDGVVPTFSQKAAAANAARRIKGVVHVVNNLAVCLSGDCSDQAIHDMFRRNLDHDSRIAEPFKIHDAVKNGVVTLSGTVPNHGQKQSAEDDAWAVPGVVDVVDALDVAPPTPRLDREILEEVRRALDSDPNLNAARITVEVADGIVYLRGTVPTYYQIRIASDDAWNVLGVKGIVNELTVNRRAAPV